MPASGKGVKVQGQKVGKARGIRGSYKEKTRNLVNGKGKIFNLKPT